MHREQHPLRTTYLSCSKITSRSGFNWMESAQKDPSFTILMQLQIFTIHKTLLRSKYWTNTNVSPLSGFAPRNYTVSHIGYRHFIGKLLLIKFLAGKFSYMRATHSPDWWFSYHVALVKMCWFSNTNIEFTKTTCWSKRWCRSILNWWQSSQSLTIYEQHNKIKQNFQEVAVSLKNYANKT